MNKSGCDCETPVYVPGVSVDDYCAGSTDEANTKAAAEWLKKANDVLASASCKDKVVVTRAWCNPTPNCGSGCTPTSCSAYYDGHWEGCDADEVNARATADCSSNMQNWANNNCCDCPEEEGRISVSISFSGSCDPTGTLNYSGPESGSFSIGASGGAVTVKPGTYYLTFTNCDCVSSDNQHFNCGGTVSPSSVTVSSGGTASATVRITY